MAKTYSNYPDAARKAARRALRHKENNGTSCGTPVGWRRASQISSGSPLTLDVIKRTFSFLSRAGVYNQGKFTDDKGKDICGSIMYAAWGGSSMKSWCSGVINKAERAAEDDAEKRHVMAVQETEESIYITLQKAPGFGGVQQDPLSNPSGPNADFIAKPEPRPGITEGPKGGGEGDGGRESQPDPIEEEQREPSMSEIERRHIEVTENTEVRLADEGRTVEGYAAVFGQPTMIGAVEEVVQHGAFDDRLNDDVVALFNHDQNMPLARSYNGQGTLELKVDEHGLFYSFKLGNQSYAKDLAESIKRGDVRGSSFGFIVREDDYEKKEDGSYRRTIKRVARIADISPVVSPAYPQTSVKMRDMIAALEAEKEIEATPENETPPTLAPKRKQAEALLSIHHHNSPKK